MKVVLLWTCINLNLIMAYKWSYSDWYQNIWTNWRKTNHVKKGFKCEKKQTYGSHGTIVSPNYPLHYPNNADCEWVIETPKEYTELHVEFIKFNIEYLKWTKLCLKDFLEIEQYGRDQKRVRKGKYCGKRSGEKLKLYGNKFRLRFKSNQFRKRRGFMIKWTAVRGCGGKVSGSHGNLKLPFSNNTERHFYCEWRIGSSASHDLKLNVKELKLDDNDGTCRHSYIQVINKNNQVISQYCHSIDMMQSIRISGEDVRVIVKLAQKTKAHAFEASWSLVKPQNIDGSCGVSKTPSFLHHAQRVRRLVGGKPAMQGEWPWIAQVKVTILTKFYRTRYITCGAVIISPSYLITAAHCVKRKNDILRYEITVGVVSENMRRRRHKIVVSANNIFAHPQYKIDKTTGKPQNDIALIRLPKKLTFDENIQPLCLPPKHHKHIFQNDCEFAGWGKTHENSLHSSHVNTIHAQLHGHCDNTDSVICVTHGENVGACKGDSGSPLMCTQKDGRKYLVGILSYGGRKCPSPVDGHVNVAYYKDWIDNILKNDHRNENE